MRIQCLRVCITSGEPRHMYLYMLGVPTCAVRWVTCVTVICDQRAVERSPLGSDRDASCKTDLHLAWIRSFRPARSGIVYNLCVNPSHATAFAAPRASGIGRLRGINLYTMCPFPFRFCTRLTFQLELKVTKPSVSHHRSRERSDGHAWYDL